jgi:hypothetical protein
MPPTPNRPQTQRVSAEPANPFVHEQFARPAERTANGYAPVSPIPNVRRSENDRRVPEDFRPELSGARYGHRRGPQPTVPTTGGEANRSEGGPSQAQRANYPRGRARVVEELVRTAAGTWRSAAAESDVESEEVYQQGEPIPGEKYVYPWPVCKTLGDVYREMHLGFAEYMPALVELERAHGSSWRRGKR